MTDMVRCAVIGMIIGSVMNPTYTKDDTRFSPEEQQLRLNIHHILMIIPSYIYEEWVQMTKG